MERVGKGTFGDVYEAYHPSAGRTDAVKVVRLVDRRGKPLDNAERIERLQSQVDEAEIMLELGLHPNIVAIRGILLLRSMQDSSGEAVADNLYVFMDYVQGGMTLAGCIEKVDMDIKTKIRVGRDVANGLVYIRQRFPNNKFIHWDVKPENILVECCRDGGGNLTPKTAKISDFGVATTSAYASPETTHRGVGSELAAETQHQWSWATTFMAMLIGKRSWNEYVQAVYELQRQLHFAQQRDDEDGRLYLSCLQLCESCMDPDPKLRCSMESVVGELSRMLGDTDDGALRVIERDRMELWKLHTNIGDILFRHLTKSSEDYARALGHLVAAKRLAAEIEGEESSLFAGSLTNLATFLHKQGKYKEAKHLPIGTEIPYQIDKWPQGRYTLMIRVDDGNWQSKKIIKPKDAARL